MYTDTLSACQRPDRASAHLCHAAGPAMHSSGRLARTREQVIWLLKADMGFAVKMFPCVLLAEGRSNASSSQTLCCRLKCVPLHSFPQTAYRRFSDDPRFLKRKGRKERRGWAKLCRQQEETPNPHNTPSTLAERRLCLTCPWEGSPFPMRFPRVCR